MSTFDPNAFLNQTIDEANSTISVPVPEAEYMAIADAPKIGTWQKKDGSASGMKLELDWVIPDSALAEELGRKEVKVRQQIMLDTTETGGLDVGRGRNVALGRLREALDLNTPGKPFSFAMIAGRQAKINVKHRVDGDAIYAEVKAVAKA